MIHLDLTPGEAETLRETLESYLSDLRAEISRTDSAQFREGLKEKKAVLGKITEELTETSRVTAR